MTTSNTINTLLTLHTSTSLYQGYLRQNTDNFHVHAYLKHTIKDKYQQQRATFFEEYGHHYDA